jgi:ribonuclease HII
MLKKASQTKWVEAGCDEAGRGCLAGPVVAAAVILPPDYHSTILNDSKQLSEKKRLLLREEIMREAISYGIGQCSPLEIDEINILKASFLAMHRAIAQLHTPPELLLIDGNRFTVYPGIPHVCQVKGDATYLHIAAASILAKTERDAIMDALDAQHPAYNWRKNKGYPTKEHRAAISEIGTTAHHRLSFRLMPVQLRLDF